MKRMVFALIFGILFGGIICGQAPDNGVVGFEPVVDFDDIFGEMTDMLVGILKEGWVLFLSLFVAWFSFMCVKSFFEGRHERWVSERKPLQHAEQGIYSREAREAVLRRRSNELRTFEREYRNRQQQRSVLGENESYVVFDKKLYVREVNSVGAVVGYRSFEQWRAERNREVEQPIHFDEYDNDGFYADEVTASYARGIDDVVEYDWSDDRVVCWLEDEKDESERNGYRDWLRSSVVSRGTECRYEEDDAYGMDSESEFEREYGSRRGEFRGGY